MIESFYSLIVGCKDVANMDSVMLLLIRFLGFRLALETGNSSFDFGSVAFNTWLTFYNNHNDNNYDYTVKSLHSRNIGTTLSVLIKGMSIFQRCPFLKGLE